MFIIFLGYCYLYINQRCFDLSNRNCSRRHLLDEVVLHVPLEVEVGELIAASKGKELGEAGVRVDLAPILLVLETLLADVGIDLLADLRPGHLGSNGLTKELGELVGNPGRLDEARGLPISSGSPLLGVLLGILELTAKDLLKCLVIGLHGSEEPGHLLKLGAELLNLDGDGRLLDHGGLLGSSGGGGDNRRGRHDGSLLIGLLGTGLGCRLYRLDRGRSGDNNILNGGELIRLGSADHVF